MKIFVFILGIICFLSGTAYALTPIEYDDVFIPSTNKLFLMVEQ
jgi:hypothetical protein